MNNSKATVLASFPTAQAKLSPTGAGWWLDGIHEVFDVKATSESRLWDEAAKCVHRYPDAKDRYRLKVEQNARVAASNY